MMLIPLTFTALALNLIGLSPGDDSDSKQPATPETTWRFVLPAPGDPFEHAPFRALVLSHEKPEDLIEKAIYRGDPARRRYAQIRFGSPGSIRVTVVLDEVGAGESDLYVDADRNRKIDDRDRATDAAAGGGPRRERIWRMPLNVSLIDKDNTRSIPRAVVFRLGSSGRTLGYAAAGYLEGRAGFKHQGDDNQYSRTQAVRRVDGDGNGFVTDAQDRLWIDSNSDESFDPSTEQFLFATVLNLDGSRYVVRSDELGSRLAFEPMVGVGTLRLALKANGTVAKANTVEMHATALGRDGSVYGLSATEPATVPVGEYRLGTVTVSLDDPGGRHRWSFIFSDNGATGEPRWNKVEKESAVTIDPIGTLRFELKQTDGARAVKAGEGIDVQPLLYTGDGLLINVAYRGEPVSPAAQETLGARISLATTNDQSLAMAHSGFA
jgi:hypothetical protein